MRNPLVSVIMPTYNRQDLILVAVESVLAQTFTDWELIIVDDGSSDNTQQLIADVMARDARVHYVQQKNQGQSVARNNGVELARGEYIAFIDSDNAWLPHRLQRGVEILSSQADIGLCYGDLIFIDIHGKELHRNNMQRHSGMVFTQLIADNFVSMNTVLVRKSVFPSHRPFNQANRLDEDYELWLDMSVNNRYHYIADFLACYRVEGNRISNNFLRRLDGNKATIDKVLDKYSLGLNNKSIQQGVSNYFLRRANILASHGGWRDYLSAALLSIRYDSLNIKKIFGLFKTAAKKLLRKS